MGDTSTAGGGAERPGRPDLILILTDQQRRDQIGCESAGAVETPHLDALAARGVIFDHAYSGSTTCIPARNALLTGLHHLQVPKHPNGVNLQEGFWTVAHALRESGYQTACIGKMHSVPMHVDLGFDTARLCEDMGYMGSAAGWASDATDDYHEWLVEQGISDYRDVPPEEWHRRSGRWFPHPAELHPTSWIEREARAVLANRDPARPLLLVVSFPNPHPPANPPDEFLARYDESELPLPPDGFEVNRDLPASFVEAMRNGFGRFKPKRTAVSEPASRGILTRMRALITQIDDSVGRILEHVDQTRSVVFFTSDHGDYAGHRGLLQKNPWIPFDDLARVPFLVAGFDVVGGRRVSELVQSCDFALTCLDYAGLDVPSPAFDTRSLRPLLQRHATDTVDADRIVMCSAIGWPMVRRGPMKYILDRQSNTSVLFDLDHDAGETHDVSRQRSFRSIGSDLARELQLRLARGVVALERFPTEQGRKS